MITRDDLVKILDFGLAKPINAGGDDQTRGASMATSAGTVLGTFGYMAPEQVRGPARRSSRRHVRVRRRALRDADREPRVQGRDRRGHDDRDPDEGSRRPGHRPACQFSPASNVPSGAVWRRHPSSDFSRPTTSRLRWRRCRLDRTISTVGGSAGASPRTIRARARLPSRMAAVDSGRASRRSRLQRPGSRAAAARAAERRWDNFTRISELAGEETAPSLSPDGTTVAYAVRVNGSWDIYASASAAATRRPSSAIRSATKAARRTRPMEPRWRFIEADADGGIFVAGATGESVRRVTDIGFHPAWSPNGKDIAFSTEEID